MCWQGKPSVSPGHHYCEHSGGWCVAISTASSHTIVSPQVYMHFIPIQAASSLAFDLDQLVVIGACLTAVVFMADYFRVKHFMKDGKDIQKFTGLVNGPFKCAAKSHDLNFIAASVRLLLVLALIVANDIMT